MNPGDEPTKLYPMDDDAIIDEILDVLHEHVIQSDSAKSNENEYQQNARAGHLCSRYHRSIQVPRTGYSDRTPTTRFVGTRSLTENLNQLSAPANNPIQMAMNQTIDSSPSGVEFFVELTPYVPPRPSFVSSRTEFLAKEIGAIEIKNTERLAAATQTPHQRTLKLTKTQEISNCRFVNLRCGTKWSQANRQVADFNIGGNTSQPAINSDDNNGPYYTVTHPSSASMNGLQNTISTSLSQTQCAREESVITSDILNTILEEKKSIWQSQALTQRQHLPYESPYQVQASGKAPSEKFKKPMPKSDDYEVIPLANGAYKRRRKAYAHWQYCCHHGRVRSTCKQCGGTSICPHNREKSKCRDCGGVSICCHSRIRSQCKECRRGTSS